MDKNEQKSEYPNIKKEILLVLKEERDLPQQLPNPIKLSNIIWYYSQLWNTNGTESDSDDNNNDNKN